MGHDDRREIFERLEALERLARSGRQERGSWGGGGRGEHDYRPRREGGRHDRDRDRGNDRGHERGRGGGDDLQEKRIIDTIVHLVSEQMGRLVEDQQARSRRRDEGRGGGDGGRGGGGGGGSGGDERRIVDLIVGLVCEHVQEIVATELDSRLGRPEPSSAGDMRPPPNDEPPGPRGGPPDSEED